MIRPLVPPSLLPKVIARKKRTYALNKALKVRPLAPPWQRGLSLCGTGGSYRHDMHDTTIDMLPDNVLLEIFDLCRRNPDRYQQFFHPAWNWHFLVHVCQRWRQVVFGSPHRLNLKILCTYGTPVRKNLCIWPAFPVIIDYRYPYSKRGNTPNDEDNVIAALEHPDRVCCVGLLITSSLLGKMTTVIQEPFPVLTRLSILSEDGNAPALPSGFLGGSAPCLQEITLSRVSYPTLPMLLLSASDLVALYLYNIPPTGYISPETVIASLATLARLETFIIEFQSATSRPDRIHPPPVTRTVLPALTYFKFRGASEYLEDLVARIDSPQLNRIYIDYLNQFVDFQVAQLSKFIDRSVGPKLTLLRHAQVTFSCGEVSFNMYRQLDHQTWDYLARTIVSCEGIDWQVSHMTQVLSHFSATLSTVVHLKLEIPLEVPLKESRQLEGTDDAEWPLLLHQFSSVQTLHVSQDLVGHIALVLEDTPREMVAEMLPSLDLICLSGQPASSVEKFVAARQLSGHPVTVIDTETEFDERLESYVSK